MFQQYSSHYCSMLTVDANLMRPRKLHDCAQSRLPFLSPLPLLCVDLHRSISRR